MHIDVAALYAAIDTNRAVQGMSWREVARAVDMSASTFSRIRSGHKPELDGYARCCRWLGVSMDVFGTQQTQDPPHLGTELVLLLKRAGVPEVYWRTLCEHVIALAR